MLTSSSKERLGTLLGEYRMACALSGSTNEAVKEARLLRQAAIDAQQIIQETAMAVQMQVHQRVSIVVSKCLAIVFDDPYEFRIVFDQKRGRTEARLVFIRNGTEVDPMTASGGGVIDVAAFALRLAAMMLSRPPVNRVLVLDEPFRFVSSEYRPRVLSMMSTLASEMNVQFIMVTHMTDLQTGSLVEVI